MAIFSSSPNHLLVTQERGNTNLQIPNTQQEIYALVGAAVPVKFNLAGGLGATPQDVWFHSWTELIPSLNSPLFQDLLGGNTGVVSSSASTTPSPTAPTQRNPLVCGSGACKIPENSIALIRLRQFDSVYGAIYETINTYMNGDTINRDAYKLVADVACSNDSLVVTYKYLCGASLTAPTTTSTTPGP